jgi:hypothetical protein
MTAIVAANANLRSAAQQFSRLTHIAIALSQMHAIGFQSLGQSDTVIHNERNVMRSTNGLQWLCKGRRLMLIQFFDPKLERGDGASGQGSLKLGRKIAAYVKRRD